MVKKISKPGSETIMLDPQATLPPMPSKRQDATEEAVAMAIENILPDVMEVVLRRPENVGLVVGPIVRELVEGNELRPVVVGLIKEVLGERQGSAIELSRHDKFMRSVVRGIMDVIRRKKKLDKDARWTIRLYVKKLDRLFECVPLANDERALSVEPVGEADVESFSDYVTRIPWGRLLVINLSDFPGVGEHIWDDAQESWNAEMPGYWTPHIGRTEMELMKDIKVISGAGNDYSGGEGAQINIRVGNTTELNGEVVRLDSFGCLLKGSQGSALAVVDYFFIPWESVALFSVQGDLVRAARARKKKIDID